jgi:hypothetical protein
LHNMPLQPYWPGSLVGHPSVVVDCVVLVALTTHLQMLCDASCLLRIQSFSVALFAAIWILFSRPPLIVQSGSL